MPQLFITCSTGLEPILEQELKSFGYSSFRRGFRGVYLDVSSLKDVYFINYASRIATRVLLPLLTFPCRGKEELYHAVKKFDWTPFFKDAKTMAVDASVDHPILRNSLFAAQLVKDAVCDQLILKTGKRPSVDLKKPDIQLNLFLRSGKGILSFDTSRDPLHKRGYRHETGEAPLRETLAAALLHIANYKPEDVLIDPCVGSGTFLIEAALIASQTPPGIFRKEWGFFYLPQFSESEWLKIKFEEDSKRTTLSKNHFLGVELNRATHRICLSNIRAAGMHPYIQVSQGDFREYKPPVAANFLISNPPYGRRVDEEDQLVSLYRGLGDFMKNQLAKPAQGFILTGSLRLSKEIGLAAKKRHVIDNGGIDARFLEFDIY